MKLHLRGEKHEMAQKNSNMQKFTNTEQHRKQEQQAYTECQQSTNHQNIMTRGHPHQQHLPAYHHHLYHGIKKSKYHILPRKRATISANNVQSYRTHIPIKVKKFQNTLCTHSQPLTPLCLKIPCV
jgi:hypothetical protein